MKTGIDCKGREWEEIDLGQAKNLSKQRFNRLTPLFRVKNNYSNGREAYWLCQCDCGNMVVSAAPGLVKNLIQSCGCLAKENVRARTIANLVGQKFGLLTVIEFIGSYGVNQNAHWKCKCECGNFTTVTTAHLRDGHTLSCGCLINRPNNRSYGELIIKNILDQNNINYLIDIPYFKDLRMINDGIGRYDFIILDNENKPIRLIEFDGIQHFKPFFKSTNPEAELKYTQINDKIKNNYALQHNLPLVRIPYTEIKNITIDNLLGDKYLVLNMEGVLKDD